METLVPLLMVTLMTYTIVKPFFHGNGSLQEWRERAAAEYAQDALHPAVSEDRMVSVFLFIAELLECEYCFSVWVAAACSYLYWVGTKNFFLGGICFFFSVAGLLDVIRTVLAAYVPGTSPDAGESGEHANHPGDA